MLTKYDDFPIQQTWEPVAYLASSDRNAYGRYWFNGHDKDGDFYFGIAFGIYPHREVMDCALSVVTKDGEQFNFRASRRLLGDRTDTRVGPATLSFVEPMRTLTFSIDKNKTGVSADMTFHANTPAHAEPVETMREGVRTVLQATRFTQFGMWGGHIQIGEKKIELDPTKVIGARDRSWGVRPAGEADLGARKKAFYADQLFWLWAPIQWENHATHYGLLEFPDGRRWKEFAQIFPRYPIGSTFDPVSTEGFKELRAGEHRLTFEQGTRFQGPSQFDLIDGEKTQTISLEPLLRFYMGGIGYYHPTWGHGCYVGEDEYILERWNVNEMSQSDWENQHVQVVVRAHCGDKVGHGVLEQLIWGPHERYGLTGLTDPLQP